MTDIGRLLWFYLGIWILVCQDFGFLVFSSGYWFDWCFTTNQLLIQTYTRRFRWTIAIQLNFYRRSTYRQKRRPDRNPARFKIQYPMKNRGESISNYFDNQVKRKMFQQFFIVQNEKLFQTIRSCTHRLYRIYLISFRCCRNKNPPTSQLYFLLRKCMIRCTQKKSASCSILFLDQNL